MKRFFACLLAGAMMLSFAACSQGETTSSSAADSSAADTSSESESTASGDLSGIVKTGGSTSVEKVMNALIYKFQENNQNVTINYEMNGSGDGIQGVIDGKYEIGHSSRDLKEEEEAEGLVGTAYAVDGIALVSTMKTLLRISQQSRLRAFTPARSPTGVRLVVLTLPSQLSFVKPAPARAARSARLWALRMQILFPLLQNAKIQALCRPLFLRTLTLSGICLSPTWTPVW